MWREHIRHNTYGNIDGDRTIESNGNNFERWRDPWAPTVDFVDGHEAGYVGAVLAQLVVPLGQVLVGDFAQRVEDEDGAVGLVVEGRVQRLEPFLASCKSDSLSDYMDSAFGVHTF